MRAPGELQILLLEVVGLVAVVVLILRLGFRKPATGTALIISGGGPTRVVFERTFVVPLLHTVEVIDISVRTITIELRGREGISCRDHIRADVRATFVVAIHRHPEDVFKAAASVGHARVGDPAALRELFAGKFVDGLRTVAKTLDFEELVAKRNDFKDELIEVIGRDLGGFILDDVALESIEQTPISQLDPDDILDAEGIRKITERTVAERLRTSELQMHMRKELAGADAILNKSPPPEIPVD